MPFKALYRITYVVYISGPNTRMASCSCTPDACFISSLAAAESWWWSQCEAAAAAGPLIHAGRGALRTSGPGTTSTSWRISLDQCCGPQQRPGPGRLVLFTKMTFLKSSAAYTTHQAVNCGRTADVVLSYDPVRFIKPPWKNGQSMNGI